MKNSLFIGNGLNRSIISDIEWGNLLKMIAEEYGVVQNEKITFPLEFENIANQILKKKKLPSPDIYDELKKKIIMQIEKATLPENAPHHRFTRLKVDSIFTSNYDYLLEKSIDAKFDYEQFKVELDSGNNRYNLKPHRIIEGKKIYHIHGELKKIQTICLGYEHYAGLLQKMRGALNKKNNNILCIHAALLDRNNTTKTWMEKFFTDNIDIVGFGLAQCEIDIWWLLTYRAYLFYSNKDGMKNLINNTITFHDVGIEPDESMKYALENIHVQYQFHKIVDLEDSTQYYDAYMEIANELEAKIGSR